MLCVNLQPADTCGNEDLSVLRIGNDIKVRVLKLHGRQVLLGVEAPPNVVVLRETVYQKALKTHLTERTKP